MSGAVATDDDLVALLEHALVRWVEDPDRGGLLNVPDVTRVRYAVGGYSTPAGRAHFDALLFRALSSGVGRSRVDAIDGELERTMVREAIDRLASACSNGALAR